ncbi:galactose-1-phosphate uridylyltransferase [Oscillatoriales cyanobacterium LEGE 11467]|uniref:Galactose-1-phosphate uridylyltransferase n=2 Tax=Zarconia TaxID=2992130 RepID=A0A928VSJ0_9CYAN|nr:galactose-1-phosphate uridylyltransferase [Zarconia navalis LEGE 11467]
MEESGQIRLNKATREWVIYAPSRRKRPQDFQQRSQEKPTLVNRVASCPFCEDGQHQSELILLELLDPDGKGWQTRTIVNKFPALTPDNSTQRSEAGIYMAMASYGQHEVVIESPDHHQTIATMPLAQVEILIETYHQRYMTLMEDPNNMMAIIFRNHGRGGGASLRHPHSQIIATGFVPRNRRIQEEEAQRYFDQWGRCVYCDILEFERHERKRAIEENDSFFAFVPFAAEVPFEIWILPKQHKADFGCISPREKSDFASILKNMLLKLYEKLNDPDYNWAIYTAARYKAEEPQVHWFCQIRPRLTTPAGFEMGSGISINPSLPEIDADFLKR